MTPVQKLKWAILLKAVAFENIADPGAITAENVDQLYDDNNQNRELQDARNEIRCTCQETDFPTPLSRHYECNSVAARMPDGSWVGWNYWYGGGKGWRVSGTRAPVPRLANCDGLTRFRPRTRS
ncbi:hypothetical protein [Comamonas sp. 26]|uniref:hypothetical protein n=1 Tax=Comamonas sp. 26 TaxID=2035201 RepID=UPI000C1939A2|nr:hypothetical protein [Comamonas sp. 26]PIG09743.1 hypothetical protein CLU84_2687 [Comamonas sp. 26]